VSACVCARHQHAHLFDFGEVVLAQVQLGQARQMGQILHIYSRDICVRWSHDGTSRVRAMAVQLCVRHGDEAS
jgi:hypothetical protein